MTRFVFTVLGTAVLAAFVASADAAIVRICDSDGNCYIFRDVPGCSEWGLGSGSTCVDLDLAIGVPIPVTTHRYKDRKVSILDLPGGNIIAATLNERGHVTRRVKLLDLGQVPGTRYLGVAARISDTTVTFPVKDKAGSFKQRRTMLEIRSLVLDRATRASVGSRSWRVDITDPASLAPFCK